MGSQLLEFAGQYHPVTLALLATLFTWLLTATGAAPVLLTKRFNQKTMDGMLDLMTDTISHGEANDITVEAERELIRICKEYHQAEEVS